MSPKQRINKPIDRMARPMTPVEREALIALHGIEITNRPTEEIHKLLLDLRRRWPTPGQWPGATLPPEPEPGENAAAAVKAKTPVSDETATEATTARPIVEKAPEEDHLTQMRAQAETQRALAEARWDLARERKKELPDTPPREGGFGGWLLKATAGTAAGVAAFLGLQAYLTKDDKEKPAPPPTPPTSPPPTTSPAAPPPAFITATQARQGILQAAVLAEGVQPHLSAPIPWIEEPQIPGELEVAEDLIAKARIDLHNSSSVGAIEDRIADSIATYDALFPAEEVRVPRSGYERLRAKWWPGFLAPGGVTLAERARSPEKLAGFAHIGGILIGRQPEGTEKLDFRDLTVKPAPGGLLFELFDGAGHRHTLGPFHAGVVHAALKYSMDDRVVTASVISAEPLEDLRNYLHPALLDTPIGCRALSFDKMSEKYTADDATLQAAMQRTWLQKSLYQYAWGVRTLAVLNSLPSAQVDVARQRAIQYSADPLVRGAAYDALHHAADFEPSRSPLTGKPDYFAPTLVADIKACAPQPAQFDHCIAERSHAENQVQLGETPTDFMFFNVVREQPYELDAELKFLSAPSGSNALWPFQFVSQVSFVTPPINAKDRYTWERSFDPKPWTYEDERVQQRVTAGVAANPISAEQLATMRDFTILQRLFRVALAERLGKRFPLSRLVDLAKQTATAAAPDGYATPRWTQRSGELERSLVRALELRAIQLERLSVSAPQLAEKAAALRQCATFLTTPRPAEEAIPDEGWLKNCWFDWKEQSSDAPEVVTAIRDVRKRSISATYARQIRSALEVAEESTDDSCPALE